MDFFSLFDTIQNMKKNILALIILNVVIFLYSQSLGIPTVTKPDVVITKSFYTLQYNEQFEQADWVAYELTREEVMGQTDRRDSFKSDPDVDTSSASLADYRGSGFDRGHLAPAADMKMSSSSMSESFYMSNMSPQNPSFNRGIWSKLESHVRTWAYENEAIFIVTGPVLTKSSYPTIGTNRVAIPEFYYKVILDYTSPGLKAIGFILPNEKGQRELESYAMSIDAVEEFTGLDFYSALSDDVEERLESSYDTSLWTFKSFRQLSTTTVQNTEVEKPTQEATTYWINSSSMSRHNSSCRYYNNTKNGYFTTSPEGKACGICGG